MMRSLSLLVMPSLAAGAVYCPGNAQDMNKEVFGGSATFQNGGWVLQGNSRVSSKTAWNLLGGSMEWDMDVSRVADAINTNFYTSSPSQPNCGAACYCDIQRTSTNPSCMELDLVENNGQCYLATTTHTHAEDGSVGNRNCDRWGCGSYMPIPANKESVHMRADFGTDGSVTVYVNGVANNNYSPVPSAESDQVVVDTMNSIGAVIESSQWHGWVPAGDKCPGGSGAGLPGSVFAVSNVRVTGTVIQGPTPTLCTDQAPTPPMPATPPAPATPPTPATPPNVANCPANTGCGCSWTQNGANCGIDDASECWCQCCCQYNGGSCLSMGSVPPPTPVTPPTTPVTPPTTPVTPPTPATPPATSPPVDPCAGVTCEAEVCKTAQCVQGSCQATNMANGASCNAASCNSQCQSAQCQNGGCACVNFADNTACSGGGSCQSGVCQAPQPPAPSPPVDPCAGVTCQAEVCKTAQCVQGTCQATNMANGAVCNPAASCDSQCQSAQCLDGGCACVNFADNTACSGGGSCQSGVCQPPSTAPAPLPPSPPATQPECLGAPAARGQPCTPTPRGSCKGVVGCCQAGLHCCGGLWWATCKDTCDSDADVQVQFAAKEAQEEEAQSNSQLLTAIASAIGGTLCGGFLVFAALRANGRGGSTNAGPSGDHAEEGDEMGTSTSGTQGRSTSRAKSKYQPAYEEADI